MTYLALHERFIQVNQRLLVSFDQLFDACVQTLERFIVGR
jgi:hypothetical protein